MTNNVLNLVVYNEHTYTGLCVLRRIIFLPPKPSSPSCVHFVFKRNLKIAYLTGRADVAFTRWTGAWHIFIIVILRQRADTKPHRAWLQRAATLVFSSLDQRIKILPGSLTNVTESSSVVTKWLCFWWPLTDIPAQTWKLFWQLLSIV